MNPRLIKRLDLIAAAAELQHRDEIARLTTTLADITTQRATLATYQSRLTQSWTNGAATTTAAAMRAELFCAAARIADQQITTREQQVEVQREAALQKLTEIKQRRQKLDDFSQENLELSRRLSERRSELR